MADQGKVLITMPAPINALRGSLVNAAGAFSANHRPAGVIYDNTGKDTKGIVQLTGTCLVRCGAAIAIGDELVSDSIGRAVPNVSVVAPAVALTDDDDAATKGVRIYAKTNDGQNGWLEFVSPTTTNGTGLLAEDGLSYFVKHNATAATGGIAVYFDEDATDASKRFLIVSPSGLDILIPVAGGRNIRLVHDANAATKGVLVYLDEDATPAEARLLFESPTDKDGEATVDSVTVTSAVSRLIALEAGTTNALIRAILI